jgi:predicted nucleotidyltransferase
MDKSTIDRIVERIVVNYRPDAVGLFGSHAIGTATATSDLDLVVIKNTREPQEQRAAHVRRLLLGVMTHIDVVVFTPRELVDARRQRHTFLNTVSQQLKLLWVRPGVTDEGLGLRP